MARQEGTVIDYGIPEIDRLQHLIILSITADSHEYGSVEGAEVKVGQGGATSIDRVLSRLQLSLPQHSIV